MILLRLGDRAVSNKCFVACQSARSVGPRGRRRSLNAFDGLRRPLGADATTAR